MNLSRDYDRLCGLRPRSKPPTYPRQRQARWDRAHLFTVGTRLTIWEAQQFAALCAQFDTTKSRVLRSMVRAWISRHMAEDSPNEYQD